MADPAELVLSLGQAEHAVEPARLNVFCGQTVMCATRAHTPLTSAASPGSVGRAGGRARVKAERQDVLAHASDEPLPLPE